MLYVRGNPLDYNTWAQFGNRGWSYESGLPYFKKAERYEGGGDDSRGADGPLNVCNMVERAELLDAFIDAASAEGFPRNKDYTTDIRKASVISRSRKRTANAGPPPAASSTRPRPAQSADRDRRLHDENHPRRQASGRRRLHQGGVAKEARCGRE